MPKLKHPIYVVVGTRAQLIKTAPVMKEMDKVGIQYSFIYTAQHRETIDEIRKDFGLKDPDYVVTIGEEAKTISLFGKWLIAILKLLIFDNKIIISKPGLLLTHGDTVTTVWGALLGKITGCKVMHLESGLRSFNLLKPFPEEINRLITFKFTDIFVCPNDWAVGNIQKYKKVIINTKNNTQYDAVHLAVNDKSILGVKLPPKYAVISIHRFENIFNTKKFKQIINIITTISNHIHCIFVLHPATIKQMEKIGLKEILKKNRNITLLKRLSFFKFIKLVNKSQFVVTDGGSNQEELSYLGKPALILRDVTERIEGLNKNAVLSKFDKGIVEKFLDDYKKYIQQPLKLNMSPSKIIINWIKNENEK